MFRKNPASFSAERSEEGRIRLTKGMSEYTTPLHIICLIIGTYESTAQILSSPLIRLLPAEIAFSVACFQPIYFAPQSLVCFIHFPSVTPSIWTLRLDFYIIELSYLPLYSPV